MIWIVQRRPVPKCGRFVPTNPRRISLPPSLWYFFDALFLHPMDKNVLRRSVGEFGRGRSSDHSHLDLHQSHRQFGCDLLAPNASPIFNPVTTGRMIHSLGFRGVLLRMMGWNDKGVPHVVQINSDGRPVCNGTAAAITAW